MVGKAAPWVKLWPWPYPGTGWFLCQEKFHPSLLEPRCDSISKDLWMTCFLVSGVLIFMGKVTFRQPVFCDLRSCRKLCDMAGHCIGCLVTLLCFFLPSVCRRSSLLVSCSNFKNHLLNRQPSRENLVLVLLSVVCFILRLLDGTHASAFLVAFYFRCAILVTHENVKTLCSDHTAH